jgi:hypothetical protein
MGSLSEQRDAYLRTQIEPGESILAVGPQGIVTDRRVLFGWLLHWPPDVGVWTHDALAFHEITRWREGRRHDHRPLVRLEHPSHVRSEWVPRHRFLWYRWGNATGEISHKETTFAFGSRRNAVFQALKARLELAGVVQGEPFVEMLPGTREQRLGRSVAVSRAETSGLQALAGLRHRLARLDQDLHRGQLSWRIRVASWLLLAAPAWLISKWLVLPAVLLAEAVWIVGLQWSWRRQRHRRPAPP